MTTTTERAVPVWGPLRFPIYRAMWLAMLGCSIGAWMQTVGAQWLLVDEPDAATLVALVQTANLLPMLLFALPAGALADSVDHRRLLFGVVTGVLAGSAALAGLAAVGDIHPAVLLTLLFLIGGGVAALIPAWNTAVIDLVPRDHVRSVSALGSISFNLARVVGPAAAGVLLARYSPAGVFAVPVVALLGFLVVLWRWRPATQAHTRNPERFLSAMRGGLRYVRHAPVARRVLFRLMLFAVPAAALFALLATVAGRRLGLDAGGYGLLLAAVGGGAIAGGLAMPWVSHRVSGNQLLAVASTTFAGGLAGLGLLEDARLLALVLIPTGTAWVWVLAGLQATMQMILPRWVRGRGMALNLVLNAGTQAVAAAGWGLLASRTSLTTSAVTAAAVMLATVVTLWRWPLLDTDKIDLEDAGEWPAPAILNEPDPEAGPVLITCRYVVNPVNEPAFLDAMQYVKRIRRRTGATRWELARDLGAPDRFVEIYLVPSWEEHMRQHEGRRTASDHRLEQQALGLAEGPPEVEHLLVS